MSAARIGVAGLWHETNTYSARRAALEGFAQYELLSGDPIVEHHRGTRSVIGGFLDGLTNVGEAVPLFSAGAWPAGPADEDTYAELIGRMRAAAREAGALDGVLLNLHGAMVAEGEPDVERAVVTALREEIGDVPIAAVLDLHGNPSPEFVAATDVVVGYNTYPHVDMWECGSEAAGLLSGVIAGERLCTVVAKVPVLTCPLSQGTDDEPMRGLLAWAQARAAEAGARRISVLPGFAYSDVSRAGMSVLVVDRVERRMLAEQIADEVAARISAVFDAGGFTVERPSAPAAVRMIADEPRRPIVLADVADNIGGGSAGDGTLLLRELTAAGVAGSVVVIADSDVALMAHGAGVGATVRASVGGKTDDLHGAPVEIEGVVVRLTDGTYISHGSWGTGLPFSMGRTAVIDTGNVTIVVTERATPPFHGEHLTSVGIDPTAASVLVAKGAIAWKAAYGDAAQAVIEVDTPGACPIDPWRLPRWTEPIGWSAVGRPSVPSGDGR
jgi:microcystin degradation protein MlrC